MFLVTQFPPQNHIKTTTIYWMPQGPGWAWRQELSNPALEASCSVLIGSSWVVSARNPFFFFSDAVRVDTGNKFKVLSMVLSKCYSVAIIRGHANVRISHGFHPHKEPETNKTTMTTFCLNISKKSPRLGIILLVAPTILGRVVTRPWEGFPYLLWPRLYWDTDCGMTER